jgi:hypothetical protein
MREEDSVTEATDALHDARELLSWCDRDQPEHAILAYVIAEVETLRELLVSAEGYAIANGADLPFVAMFVEDSPKAAAIERAGCYPRDARREHPGRFALNPPPAR